MNKNKILKTNKGECNLDEMSCIILKENAVFCLNQEQIFFSKPFDDLNTFESNFRCKKGNKRIKKSQTIVIE